MIVRLPRLVQVRAARTASKRRRILVFVHGIFSSHTTFAALAAAFERDTRFDAYDIATYDYDWGEPILRSAERLRDILNARVPLHSEVTLVGHSMGGLVSRFALVAGDLPCVTRIVMLGTPNFGALSARQLSTLWQVGIAAAGRITPVLPRKAGLRDLTRPQTLYERIAHPPSLPATRALEVEYVTIPGLFYHDERRDTETGENDEALPFTLGTLAVRAMALWPFGEIEIERPHDGIVEESSVSMMPKASRVSEKNAALQQPGLDAHYCHAVPVSMRQRAHMGIQHDAATAETIKEIMLAGGADTWKKALTFGQRAGYITIDPP